MLERTLVYVDTSYLLASFYNSWEEGARGQLEISLASVVTTINHHARLQVNQPVQRQFWYDGIPDSGPHRYQRTLRVIEGVQLRAGQLIEWGERRTQKAVDTLLVADMVAAALRGQCSDMVLVSGDADMIPGVSAAVEAGIRVHLIGFGWDSIASSLRHRCDTCTVLDPRTDFAESMQVRPLEGPVTPRVRSASRPATPGEEGHDDSSDDAIAPHDADLRDSRASAESVAHEAQAAAEAARSAADEELEAEAEAAEGCPGAESEQRSDLGEAVGRGVAGDRRPRPRDPARAGDAEQPGDRAGASAPRDRADHAAPSPADVAAAAGQGRPADAPLGGPAPDGEGRDGLGDADAGAGVDAAEADGRTADSAGAAPEAGETDEAPAAKPGPVRPNPSMMAARRKPLRSRYVPLSSEVWTSSGDPTPFDVGQQYATWWYEQAADDDQRDRAHVLSGGPLPLEVDRPLLQFACQMLNAFTLSDAQRVALRDGFHEGIRAVLVRRSGR